MKKILNNTVCTFIIICSLLILIGCNDNSSNQKHAIGQDSKKENTVQKVTKTNIKEVEQTSGQNSIDKQLIEYLDALTKGNIPIMKKYLHPKIVKYLLRSLNNEYTIDQILEISARRQKDELQRLKKVGGYSYHKLNRKINEGSLESNYFKVFEVEEIIEAENFKQTHGIIYLLALSKNNNNWSFVALHEETKPALREIFSKEAIIFIYKNVDLEKSKVEFSDDEFDKYLEK